MTKTYRIKSRTRFTCFVTLTIILITILANFALGFSTASSLTVPQYEEIRIQSGQIHCGTLPAGTRTTARISAQPYMKYVR